MNRHPVARHSSLFSWLYLYAIDRKGCIGGEWCLFNSLACGWDTKGGQTVLNGLEGASVETYTPEQKKEIYQAVAKMQKEAWDKGSGYFYWSYKLLTDTVNTDGWVGWDSWDLGRCYDFGWFPADKGGC